MTARRKSQYDGRKIGEEPLGFLKLLLELNDGDGPLPDPKADPGFAFRYVYDGFVRRGDYERGKPRHSVRQIKEWLGENQVRSLETKLAGKTWLKYEDALFLLKVFLSRWDYDKAEKRYTAYSGDDLDVLTSGFLEDLFQDRDNGILLPDRSRATRDTTVSEVLNEARSATALEITKPSGEVIREDFANGDALVTVSRVRTIIDTNPARAMTGFNRLMADLYEIDRLDERKRAAIWVIDLGLRDKQESARGAIYNFQFLAAQFHAIALTEAPYPISAEQEAVDISEFGHERSDQRDLYSWLQKSTCFIVGSLSQVEINAIYERANVDLPTKRLDYPWFQSDRLFLESLPTRWLDAKGSEAFGVSQGELWQMPTITAHLRMENWHNANHPPEVDRSRNLRYFFHGSIEDLGIDEDPIRCIELPQPGARWSNAYRLACNAAFLRLGYASEKPLADAGTPEEALILLRNQNFGALRLDEFLDLPRFLSKPATKD